jgi:hypothetical protein
MPIDRPQKYLEGIWDWGFLNEVCFPGTSPNYGISDLDGFSDYEGIEPKQGYNHRRGHHLLIEAKDVNVRIKKGQLIYHADLTKIGFSIIYLWGKANTFPIRKLQWWREFRENPNEPRQEVSKDRLIELVCKWFQHADRYPISPPPEAAFYTSKEGDF